MSTFQQTHASNLDKGISTDPDFKVPSCTIEDVDRAVFNLFESDLDLFYKHQGTVVKIPIVFATGERFAILSRNKPLRDKNNTLILPLVSIARGTISMQPSPGMGTNQTQPIVIKRRLNRDDPSYQQLMNKESLKNQDNRVDSSHKLSGNGTGTVPGKIATRRTRNTTPAEYRSGRLFADVESNNNIFEIFEVPHVKYYTANYDVTIWTQYVQQMNDVLMSILDSTHTNSVPTFRIETDKGYTFVAYLQGDISADTNFSDFTDSERIVRYSMQIKVPAYLINPDYEGSRNQIRRYISAPQITFDITAINGKLSQKQIVGVRNGTAPDANLAPSDEPPEGQSIGGKSVADTGDYYDNTSIGGSESGRSTVEVVRTYVDPVTGEEVNEVLPFKQRNLIKGETVYKAQITDNLGTINVVPK